MVKEFMAIDYRAVLTQIQNDSVYQKNILLGEPRRGHPEGTIGAHIAELEENLEKLRGKLSESEVDKLRLMIHVHDTLKPDAKEGVPISDPQSHATLACEFLARYCQDSSMLQMIQGHDEPYALYLQFKKRGECDAGRWQRLFETIDDWDLFQAFLIIDNCTRGKDRQSLTWFFEASALQVQTRWSVADFVCHETKKCKK